MNTFRALILAAVAALALAACEKRPHPADIELGAAADHMMGLIAEGKLATTPDRDDGQMATFARRTQPATDQPGSQPTHFWYSVSVQTGETWKRIIIADRVSNGSYGQGVNVTVTWHNYDGFWKIAGWSNMPIAFDTDWQDPQSREYQMLKGLVMKAFAAAEKCSIDNTSC